MRLLRHRRLATIGAAVLSASLLASSAAAAAADSTFFSMVSQPGDYIGQGLTYYFTPATATFGATYNGSAAHFSVITPGYAEWWYIDIAAPPGQPLVVGSYSNAVRSAFRGAGQPGLDVYGDGRGCNTVTGSFTVLRAVYGPDNSVIHFDATFAEQCEGFMPQFTGEIRYDATPTLTLGATISASGTVSKRSKQAKVSGTVSCSLPVTVAVSGTVSESLRKGTASAPFSVQVACTGSSSAWSATVSSTSGRDFAAGHASVSLSASATESSSGQQATTTAVGSVNLTQVR